MEIIVCTQQWIKQNSLEEKSFEKHKKNIGQLFQHDFKILFNETITKKFQNRDTSTQGRYIAR